MVIALAAAGPAAAGRYTVRSGDTLSGIAARHGVSVRALADANGITDVHHVRAGSTLSIPGAGGAAPAVAAGSYTVRSGDTLSGIAARHGVSVRALADANGISNVHLVRIGARLAVPGGSRQGTAPAAGSYAVRSGDTLSGIAARHGVSVRALADANGITDIHLVRIGTRLSVPSPDLAPAATTPAPGARGSYPARLRSSPSRLALVPSFERWAATYGVPVDLLMALTWLESGWQNHVVSSAGAIGIGQLLPGTVTWMSDIVIGVPLDPHNPDDNIRISARYLRWLLDRTGGDVVTALAGYYQGLGSVRAAGVYPVSKAYAANVIAVRDRWF